MNDAVPLTPEALRVVLGTLDALLTAEAFAVHFLRDDQRRLCARFAHALLGKWEYIPCRDGVTGCPVLERALALLECRLCAQYDGDDHVIIAGRVEHIERQPDENPLVFFRGRYHTLGAEAEILNEETEAPPR